MWVHVCGGWVGVWICVCLCWKEERYNISVVVFQSLLLIHTLYIPGSRIACHRLYFESVLFNVQSIHGKSVSETCRPPGN